MKTVRKISSKTIALLLVFSVTFSSMVSASPGPNLVLIDYNGQTMVYEFDPITGVDSSVLAQFREHVAHALTTSPFEPNIRLHYTCGSFASYDMHLYDLDFTAFLNHQDTNIDNSTPLAFTLMTTGGAIGINKSELHSTIGNAISLAANVITATSPAEAGTNLWVTPTAHAAFESYINWAQSITGSINFARTQADINTAVANLENAMTIFNAEIYVSSAKSAVAPSVDLNVAANRDAAIIAYESARDRVNNLTASAAQIDLDARLVTVQDKIQAALAQASYAATAGALIQGHTFQDISIPWDDSQNVMLQSALDNINTQLNNLPLTNIVSVSASFPTGATPAITVAGIPRVSHPVIVTITDTNTVLAAANINVYITFGRRPLAIPVYSQLAFDLPQEGIIMESNINIVPMGSSWNPANAISLMENGQSFRREWLTYGTVLTLYYELVDDSVNTQIAGNLRFAFRDGGGYANNWLHDSSATSLYSSHAIVDTVGHTLQGTHDAFINYWATSPNAIFGDYDGIVIFAGASHANIRVTGITIGTTISMIPPWEGGFVDPMPLRQGEITVGVMNGAIVNGEITVQRGQSVQFFLIVNGIPFSPVVAAVGWKLYGTTGRHANSSSITRRGYLHIAQDESANRLYVRGGSVTDWSRYLVITVHVID